jgi:hypothetical protein
MPRFRDHDWDLRPDGNGFVWRVFGGDGQALILRQGWAGTRRRAEELAHTAIAAMMEPAVGEAPAAHSFLSRFMARPRRTA